jgi:UPF0176 protein
MKYIVAAFYHFFDFSNFAEHRAAIKRKMDRLGITGTLLLTPEGINSTVAGSREAMDQFLDYLKREVIRGEMEHKESETEEQPFGKAKVRLKQETIGLGEYCPLPKVGQYVSPQEWNALISDPDTIVLDTRNDYEVHLGTFERAIDPEIRNFKQLPQFVRDTLADKKQKKIATFCTGGIRCEKFTAWMQDNGYENVYHLKGGILKYLEEIPPEESLWNGECYVFDRRIAVGHGLAPSQTASYCFACGHTLKPEEREDTRFVEGESCLYCYIAK